MKRMALFGGTFDPIHSSHVSLALRLADKLALDGVILMPTFVPPHKIRESMAPAEDRLAMCRLAAQEHPVLQVSELELQRQGASFTADTLEELARQYPDTRWYLITGADMFCTLRTWHRFEDFARLAVLCTVPREGTELARLREYAAGLATDGYECYVDEHPEAAVSSTEIRQRAAAGKSLAGLVPEAVEDYIRERGLYASAAPADTRTRDEQFTEIIRTRLSEYRFRHSLCVAQEAVRLAKKYGADEEKAYTAGLLHDIMKDTAPNTQLQILEEFGIMPNETEKASPTLWHAMSGAAFIEHILGVDDPELLQAVRYHTTGRGGMSPLEKVLFVADFTSADRTYPDVEVMRRLADESLERAMVYGIDYTVRELLTAGRVIHPDTVAAYNHIVLSEQRTGGHTDEK